MENEYLEISAKTAEEAIEEALERLGASNDEVDITVIKKGRTGILGVGSEDALVRVQKLSTLSPVNEEDTTSKTIPLKEDTVQIARGLIEELIQLLNLEATVDLLQASPDDEMVAFDIKGDDLGVLIGRRGQTLASFQYLVRLMVAQQVHSWTPLTVDIEGYKKRRLESLRSLALRLADRVTSNKRSMTLEPMPPDERRMVHMALADHPDVTTQSIGDGDSRKVTILPILPKRR